MESKSEQRTERDGIDRPPAEYHFFRSRKFFTFPFSDYRRRRRRLFKRTMGWKGRREEFPLSPFPLLPTACSRGARRAAPLLVLSFVNLDERSRLGFPSLHSFFFSSSPRCRRPSLCRWEAYAMMLFSLAERERRRQEKIRRNLTENACVRMSAWNRRDLLLQIRNFSRNQIARRKREGSTEFSLPRYDLQLRVLCNRLQLLGFSEKSFMSKSFLWRVSRNTNAIF